MRTLCVCIGYVCEQLYDGNYCNPMYSHICRYHNIVRQYYVIRTVRIERTFDYTVAARLPVRRCAQTKH